MSTTAEDLKRRLATQPDALKERIGKAEPVSAGEAFGSRAYRSLANNVLALPDASGNLMADAVNVGRAAVGKAARGGINNARSLVGMPRRPNPSLGERYNEASDNETVLQAALRGIPRPSIEGILSADRSIPALLPGGESPSEAYARNMELQKQQEERLRSSHPVASAAGDISGDIAALVLGRRSTGANTAMQRLETKLASYAGLGKAGSALEDVTKVVTGPAMRRLARGSGRAVESGVEAAALDILKDPNADPIETAALAAGGQLFGSGTLSLAKGLVSGSPTSVGTKLTIAALSTAGLVQVLKSATPGDRDRVLESIETGYDKVAFALAVGMGSAAVGATRYGRGNTALSEQMRSMLDGLATVHRGTVLSVLSDWTEGDDKNRATIEKVLNSLAADPSYKGDTPKEQELVTRLQNNVQYKTQGQF